jgi:hypothetical protein
MMKKRFFRQFDIVVHRHSSNRYVVTGFVGGGTGTVVCKDVYTGSYHHYHYSQLKRRA